MIIEARRDTSRVGHALTLATFLAGYSADDYSLAAEAAIRAIATWKYSGPPFSAYARRVVARALVDNERYMKPRRFATTEYQESYDVGHCDQYFAVPVEEIARIEENYTRPNKRRTLESLKPGDAETIKYITQ